MNNDVAELLEEIKSVRKKIDAFTNIVLIVVLILAASSTYQTYFSRPRNQEDNWRSANAAMEKLDYEKAEGIVRRLIEKNPNYYYGYSYWGAIALERNQLEEAERQYARAYELFSTADNEQLLQATRKRLTSNLR